MDKTGTVTKGKPELTDVIITSTISEEEFLIIVATAEKNSEHPLAEAIVTGVQERNLALLDPEAFEAVPGFGIRSVVSGKEVLIGTRKWMVYNQIQADAAFEQMYALEESGKTAMLVAIDEQSPNRLGLSRCSRRSCQKGRQ